MGAQRPLPETDTDARPFWDGAANGKLLIQRCNDCKHYQHYARPFCIACSGRNVEMVESSGRGIVYSFTVVHRSPYEDLPAPYVVALVKLDEGVTLLSNVVGCDPARMVCDMPVQVSFAPLRDSIVLPVFEPRGS
jgi:hypothetical protein